MKIRQQANRGKPLETLVEVANRQYRSRGLAVIHKVPTAWLPLRDGTGRIVSAKVEEKAAVDFLGVYRERAVAFDAKHEAGHRVRWDRIEEHQARFLQNWMTAGGNAYVLVSFGLQRHFLIPWILWTEGVATWHDGGPASLAAADIPAEYEVTPTTRRITLDYLAVMDRFMGEDKDHAERREMARAGDRGSAGGRRNGLDARGGPDVALAPAGRRRAARDGAVAGERRA